MSSTGNVLPGSGASVTRSATAWTSPGNITADDASDATCNSGASGSDYLVASSFGFSIPVGSQILGVTVRVEASEHTSGTESLNAQLQNDSATLIGSSQAQTVNGTGKAVYTYGGAADVWGAALTAAMVNDPDFGVRLWFTTTHDVRVDFVTVSVEYLTPFTSRPQPNPQGPRQAGFTHLGVNLLLTTLAVAAGPATIFRQPIQTRIPATPVQQPFVVANQLPLTTPTQDPFRLLDQPNPLRPTWRIPEGPPNVLVTYPAPTPMIFRAPLYTRSVRPEIRQYEQSPNLALLAPPAPLKSHDFPNPRGASYPVSLRTWTNQTRIVQDDSITMILWGPPLSGRTDLRLYQPGESRLALTTVPDTGTTFRAPLYALPRGQVALRSLYDPGARALIAAPSGEMAGSVSLDLTATGSLTGAGELIGSIPLAVTPTGALTGAGALTGTLAMTIDPSGSLTGAGALTGTTALSIDLSAALTGAGAITGSVAMSLTPVGSLTGAGALSGAVSLTLEPTGALTGSGGLTGAVSISLDPAGSLTGAGALTGAAALSLDVTGALTGSGAMAGTVPLSLTSTGSLTGAGALSGSVPMSLTVSGIFEGTGQLTGAVSLVITATGELTGQGLLEGAIPLSLSPSGSLTGVGALNGSTSLALNVSGALVNGASGAITGTVPLSLAAVGELIGFGALDGSTALAFQVAGLFFGSGAVDGNVELSLSITGTLTNTTVEKGNLDVLPRQRVFHVSARQRVFLVYPRRKFVSTGDS